MIKDILRLIIAWGTMGAVIAFWYSVIPHRAGCGHG